MLVETVLCGVMGDGNGCDRGSWASRSMARRAVGVKVVGWSGGDGCVRWENRNGKGRLMWARKLVRKFLFGAVGTMLGGVAERMSRGSGVM